MINQKIEIPSFSFVNTEIIDSLPDLIILSEFDIEYRWKLTAKITDKDENDTVEKERKFQGNKSLLKSKIVGVSAIWDDKKQCYTTSAFTNNDDVTTVHKTFAEALKLKEQIMNWLKS